MAHSSKCKALIEIYNQGRDLYSEMASAIFEKPLEECLDGSIYRKQTKMIVLAILYGMGKYSLADILKISDDEAQKMMDDFFKVYPEVETWIKANEKEVMARGYVETAFGSRRRFPNADFTVLKKRWSEEIRAARGKANRALRQTTNAKIQGGAAYQTKLVMKALKENLDMLNEERGYKAFEILAQVHDELLFYVPEDITPLELTTIEYVMISTVKLIVPSKTDLAIGKSWGMLKGIQYKGLDKAVVELDEGLVALDKIEWSEYL